MTVTVDQLERAGAATWSPDVSVVIGGWSVTSNGGFTRRVNSATASGLAETSLEVKRSVSEWLSERGAPLVVRVTPLTDPSTAESCQRNWFLDRRDETIVMAKRIETVPDRQAVARVDPSDARFMEEFFALNARRPHDDDVWRRMVGRIGSAATGLRIDDAAVGFVAVSESIAFVYSLAVRPDERRSGLATRLMADAQAWSDDRGATWMAVQVLGTNAPATGLYERLGFAEIYRYHYLQADSR